jgi:hypothetical protein
MTVMSPSVAALAPVVDAVVEQPVGDLCAAELQAGIAGVALQADRLLGWVSAASGQLQAATGGKVATDTGGERSVAGWLAEATRTSSSAAGARLRTSTALRDLPLVVQAVLDGVITQENAAILARLVGRIPLEHLIEVQTQLIEVATGRDPAQLAGWVRHQIATHVEPVLDDDEAGAHDRRYLTTRRGADGSVQGSFSLAPGDAEPFLTVVEAGSRKQGEEDRRSAGQRRADALIEMAEQVLRHGELPDHGGQRPQVSYVLPADWAARQAERLSCPTCTSCPGHRPASFADTVAAALPGSPGVPAEWACATAAWTGPATRARIETLLCDARISRVLLDQTGQVTGLEALRDTVTASQRRALAARDGRCTARGCTRPPAMCDAHHLISLADGGPTGLGNLVLLCRRHHVLWHLGKLTLADLHIPWHPDAAGADPPLASAP